MIVVLRRASDVLLTLAPLLLSGLVTLAVCVALSEPLNYANIIALPLLYVGTSRARQHLVVIAPPAVLERLR